MTTTIFNTSSNPRRTQILVVFIFSIILYGNTIPFSYVLDDKIVITHNDFVKQGVGGITKILSTDLFVGFLGEDKDLVTGGRYRPLSLITYAIEYEFLGESPQFSHFVNTCLYAISCVLLFFLLDKLLKKVTAPWYLNVALISTLIFCAHPLHTEVVANIKGRDEILSFMLATLTFLTVLKFADSKKISSLVQTFLFFFLGLLSKENTIVFLALIPLAFYFFRTDNLKTIFIANSPLFIAVAGYFILRYSLLGSPNTTIPNELMNNPFTGASTVEKFATISYTLGLYLKLSVFPHPLTHDYYPFHIPITSFNDWRAILSLLIYSGLFGYLIYGFIHKHLFAYCILIFFAGLALASNILFPIGTFMNERFMFVSVLGLAIIIATLITKHFPKSVSNPKIRIATVCAILFLFSVKTITRNYAWESDDTLFLTDVNVSKNSAKVNMSAGDALINISDREEDPINKKQQLAQAIEYLNKSIEIYPTYGPAWVLKGNALCKLERYNEAFIPFENALKIGQLEATQSLMYAAQQLVEMKEYADAIKAYQTVLPYYQDKAEIYNRIGMIQGRNLNDLTSAWSSFQKGLETDSDHIGCLENLGVIYGMTGKHLEAIKVFEQLLKLNPNNISALHNISASYGLIGNSEMAEYYSNQAQALQGQL